MLRSPGKRAWRRQETARREREKLEREQERQRNAPVSTLLLSSPPIPLPPTLSLPPPDHYIRPTPTAQRPVIVISLGRDVPPLILDANPRNLATMGPRDRLTTLDVVLAEMAAGPPTPPAAAASPVPNPAPIPTPILAVNNSPREPERWSGLRDPSAHPWRSLRRRKQRLRGSTSPWTRIPADVAYGRGSRPIPPAATDIAVLTVHEISARPMYCSVETQTDDLPAPTFAAVGTETTAEYDNTPYGLDVGNIASPLPVAPPAPLHRLPARTAYGIVQSGLALVCGRELPEMRKRLQKLLVYAYPATLNGRPEILRPDSLVSQLRRRHVLAFRPDRLVFLATLAAIMDVDDDLRPFLQSAVTEFLESVVWSRSSGIS
ncbi:hypothetical protein MKEN_00726500 [Mycena kentingensis (nom. inval.)]|nr:hypothetical protein MKEN_00726500 [Mycena kentingensis (nom. inval.)]